MIQMAIHLPPQGSKGTLATRANALDNLVSIAAANAMDSLTTYTTFDEVGTLGIKFTAKKELEPDIAFVPIPGSHQFLLFARFGANDVPRALPSYSWKRGTSSALHVALRSVAKPTQWWVTTGPCRLHTSGAIELNDLVNLATDEVVRSATVYGTLNGLHAKLENSMVTVYLSGPLFQAITQMPDRMVP